MNQPPKMLIEHGVLPGETLNPDQPGMEDSASIIPDTQKMNPNCPCMTRTCPLHGYCQYCVQHHEDIVRGVIGTDLEQTCHFHHCKQDLMLERYGAERTVAEARKNGIKVTEEAKANREAQEGVYPVRLGGIGIGRRLIDRKSGITFLLAAQDHYGPGITTLLTENIVGVRALDAAESGPEGKRPFEQKREFGNNNYPLSNLHQWLNSNETDWYHATHEYDMPPVAEQLRRGEYPYAGKEGFLCRFSEAVRDHLVETEIPVLIRTGRGEGKLETVRAGVFLPSRTEMNKGDELGIPEGKTLPIFYDHYIFKAVPSPEQIEKYGRDWNREEPEYGLLFDVPQMYDPKFGWWYYMRTPGTMYDFMQRVYTAYGTVSYTYANNDIVGIRPLMNLSSDMEVFDVGERSPLYRMG